METEEKQDYEGEYLKEISQETLNLARIMAFAGLPIFLFMILLDLFILNTRLFLFWRIASLTSLLLLLLGVVTPVKEKSRVIFLLHGTAVSTTILSMNGIIFTAYANKSLGNPFIVGSTLGLITAVFCIYLVAGGGLKPYLRWILLLPFMINAVAITFFLKPSLFDLSYLINPLLIILGTIIIAEEQEKLKKSRFYLRFSLDRQKREYEKESAYRKTLENLLMEKRNLDDLTGLFHRRAGIKILQELLFLSDVTGKPISMALLDLDGIRFLNTSLGYSKVDSVLADFAGLLKRYFLFSGYLIRYGEDSFLVVLIGSTLEDLQREIQRIRDELLSQDKPEIMPVTFSTGYAFRAAGSAFQLNEFLGKLEGSLGIKKNKRRTANLSQDIRFLKN